MIFPVRFETCMEESYGSFFYVLTLLQGVGGLRISSLKVWEGKI